MHTSFSDSDTLGKFNEDCAAIGRQIDARAEELKAARQEIDRLTSIVQAQVQRNNELLCVLGDCYDYFDSRADADCDQDGFIPNEEMKMLSSLKELGL